MTDIRTLERLLAPPASREFALIQIDRPTADAPLHPGDIVRGSGWVVANRAVATIAVFLNDRFLCAAAYGEQRPAITERYPHFEQSDAPGFSFSAELDPDLDPAETAWLFVHVTTVTGARHRQGVPVCIRAPAEPDRAVPPAENLGIHPIRLSVDHARIDHSGLLRISGWAISRAPLQKLELFLGDAPLGEPERNLARPDVAAAWPDYPGAGKGGFRLVKGLETAPGPGAALRVRATLWGGVTRQVIVPVTHLGARREAASEEGGIHVCIDTATLSGDGAVSVTGWAVATPGVAAIHAELGGAFLAHADLGHERPDVANRFPRIASARRSGFSLKGRLEGDPASEPALTLHVTDAASATRTLRLPLSVDQDTQPDHTLADAPAIRFDIDSPALAGDRAREPVRGVLTLSGWALRQGGIKEVEVYLDGHSLGLAYYGMRREDIAAAFPRVEGARLSGFAMTIPRHLLGAGERAMRVEFRAKDGQVEERAFQIDVAESEDEIASTQLARRLGRAARDMALRSLAVAPTRTFALILVRATAADTDEGLAATLDSLDAQVFEAWRAVLIPGAPQDRPRLKRLLRDRPPGKTRISAATAESLPELTTAAARGDTAMLASLRAGDQLGVDALLRLAQARALDPQTELFYTDERRHDPSAGATIAFFKPDWSPELLLSTNYIGRSWFAAASLLDRLAIGLEDFTTRSDYTLILRLTARATHIGHLPQVLIDTSAASPEPAETEQAALEGELALRGDQATVTPGLAPATWRITRALTAPGKVSIIIPTAAARDLVETCVNSIRSTTAYRNFELILIDNIPAANPRAKQWIRDHADLVLDVPDPFNWSRFNNLGAAAATGDFLLFLNDDIEILDPAWLETLLAEAQRPEIGVVGPQLLYPDRKVQHAGMFLADGHARHAFRFARADDPGYAGLALTQRNVIAVTGACMLMRRESFDRLGGFDEAHSVTNNDIDYCLRAWSAGQRIVYTPFASLIHHELATRAALSDTYDETRFKARWSGAFARGDPYFNPNLSTDTDSYAVETEPLEIIHSGQPAVPAAEVRHILAVKLDHIGDFILAFPAMRRLKQRFPNAKLTVLAARASRALADLEPAIDQLIEFDFFHARSDLGRRDIPAGELEALRARLAPMNFDLAIDLRLHPDTRPMLRHTGARLLAGYDHAGRFPWLDVALEWEGDTRLAAKRTHVVDRLEQIVEAAAIACGADRGGAPAMDLEEAWRRLRAIPAIAELPADFLDKPLVCVHPAVGNDTRQWPPEHFAGLIDMLVADEGVHVALIGSRDEIDVADRVLAGVRQKDAVVSLLGKLTLSELPPLLRVARLYVGNNSGPKHLAAALGTPTVGVHSGVVDAAEWGPFGANAVAVRRKTVCSPCYVATAADCHRGLACLEKLRPSDMFAICGRMTALRGASLEDGTGVRCRANDLGAGKLKMTESSRIPV